MLQISQKSKILDNIETNVVIQAFADRILVVVTQLGKVGTLVRTKLHMETKQAFLAIMPNRFKHGYQKQPLFKEILQMSWNITRMAN